jgi:hypothetical protein
VSANRIAIRLGGTNSHAKDSTAKSPPAALSRELLPSRLIPQRHRTGLLIKSALRIARGLGLVTLCWRLRPGLPAVMKSTALKTAQPWPLAPEVPLLARPTVNHGLRAWI